MISTVDEMRRPPRLPDSIDACEGAALARAARLDASRVQVVAETDSTNLDLMSRPAEPGAPSPRLLLARRQRAGRGRRGRTWLSDPLDSLTMSVSVQRPRDPSAPALTGLSLALGVALAELAALHAPDVALKWPNDLLRDGRKCAGMLVETRWAGEFERVVVGVGLNWRLSPSLAESLPQAGGLLDALPPAQTRERIAGEIARALIDAALRFFDEGFGDTAARWARFDALAGREVVVFADGAPPATGVAEGVDRSGALRLRTAQGLRPVFAGEVSVRLAGAPAGMGVAGP